MFQSVHNFWLSPPYKGCQGLYKSFYPNRVVCYVWIGTTQIYKIFSKPTNKMRAKDILREAVADMFGMLEYKVRNDAMTYEDLQSLISLYESHGGVKATAKDLAGYYGQSEDNVRHILYRSYMPKPVRRVYYDMLSFAKNVPLKWRRNGSNSDL